MSSSYETAITCPDCGKDGPFIIWRSINVDISEGMGEAVRDGSAFLFTCPHCGSKHPVDYGFLYHDMHNKIWIHYTQSDEDEKKVLDMLTGDDFMVKELVTEGYIIRIVRSMNQLREKLFIFDNNYDDRVIEYMKLIFASMLLKEHPEEDFDEILLFIDNDGNKSFEFIRDGKGFADAPIDDELYKKVEPILEEKSIPALRPSTGKIDFSWARDNLL